MKRIIITVIASLITAGAYAQTDSTNSRMSPPDFNNHTNDGMNQNREINGKTSQDMKHNPDTMMEYQLLDNHPDGVMMVGGKMWIIKNNKMSVLDRTITMSNGTKVQIDGSYMKKEGSKLIFSEGEHMDMTGKLIPMK